VGGVTSVPYCEYWLEVQVRKVKPRPKPK
jgi:hypothetical protein